MLKVVVRRVGAMVPLLLIVSITVFSLIHLLPGDAVAAMIGEGAVSEEYVERMRRQLGLDRPIPVQYVVWLHDVIRGDLGVSLSTGQEVRAAIFRRGPVTLSLTIASLAVAIALGLPAGVIGGLRPGSVMDRLVVLLATVGIAIPSFWLGLMLVLGFALMVPIFPPIGYKPVSESVSQWLMHLALPALTLGSAGAAEIARQTRSAVIDAAQAGHVRTAWAKGMPSTRVMRRHILRNAYLPVVTVFGLQAAYLVGSAVVVEIVFGLPGLGSLAVRAVFERDIPMIQGLMIVITVGVLVINLIVDILYSYLDPRIRQL